MTMAFGFRRAARKVRLALWIAAVLLALAHVSGCGAPSGDDQTLAWKFNAISRRGGTPWPTVWSSRAVSGFRWEAFDQFPHPTYKGGSEEAYQRFAEILIAFYEGDDNFDYLTRNKCFSITLRYVFPSGQAGVQTSFAQLTEDFRATIGCPQKRATSLRLSRRAFERLE